MARVFPLHLRLRSCLLLFGLLASSASAHATVVERIVAVVGDKAILLTDLRSRAAPFLIQVHQSVPEGAPRNAAISQLYRNVLDRLVDEELELRAAQQSKLTVTAKEIDEALTRVASQNKLTVQALLAEANRNGLGENAYRDELRRQLLEAKLINVRLQGRIRVAEEDLRDAYRKLVLEERQRLSFTPAWIVVAAGADRNAHRAQRALAESLSARATVADFRELARLHSEDAASKSQGGVLRRMTIKELPAPLARIALGLEVGQTSAAVRLGDRYVVLKLMARDKSELPAFEQARQELAERVYLEKMAQAKKIWLDGLRRQHHVEVRL